ncbi:MAG: BolA family protein [Polyangiaceae bacterium]
MIFQTRIEEKLKAALSPSVLDVINESSNHSVPKGSETHFKVVVVSPAFEGKMPLARHRLIFGILDDEMTQKPGVHALSIVAKTPEEWARDEAVRESPKCHGGSKAEKKS